MSIININYYQYLELEKIAYGAFHPIDSFMSSKDFRSVVYEFHLRKGDFFPLPVFLDIDNECKDSLQMKDVVDLMYKNMKVGSINITEIYKIKKLDYVKKIYGTTSTKHPGVKFFLNSKEWFVAGKIKLTNNFDKKKNQEKTPAEIKNIFKKKKWKTIVGFQTRNIPHKAHEYLQRIALEYVDALYINPLIGWKKKGDYTADAISVGYTSYMKSFLNKKRVILNLTRMNMRYAGPREALFHAVVRKNYGCTHFIIGRDHAGVGNFYGKYAAHSLVDKFANELGIKIMKFCGPFYCKICNGIVTEKTCDHNNQSITHISGTYIRDLLMKKKKIDDRFIRKETIESLKKTKVFIE